MDNWSAIAPMLIRFHQTAPQRLGGYTPFRNEKNSNWEGAFRVPAFVRWPGHARPTQFLICLWNFLPRSRFYGERGLDMLTWNAPVNGRVQVEKSRKRPLAGQRILFAEDEGLIALELERMLVSTSADASRKTINIFGKWMSS